MAVIKVRLRRATWPCLLLPLMLVACGGDAGKEPQTADGRSDQAARSQSVAFDESNAEGPGLRATSTESLQLPVLRTFDLAHVQPRHFAAALGKDPVRIFEFVRNSIAFEPYSGCLRGPRGTLMAMAGNSVDRAALLASLLESSGERVRYARGMLKESVAQELVASMWAGRPTGRSAEAEDSSPEFKNDVEKLMAAIERDSRSLAEILGKAGHPDSRKPALTGGTLVAEARDHYWVEWWQNDKWVALDPSFASAAPGQQFAEAESTFDALPEELFHRVEMHVRVEEYVGDTSALREVVDFSANAADLSGADILLSHEAAESEGLQVRPVLLVQQEQVIGLPFWLEVPIGNPAGGLADALGGGGGGDESTPTATAEFVELTFIAPDGRRESVVREIFDRVGKKKRSSRAKFTVADLTAVGSDAGRWESLPGAIYDFFITTGAIHVEHLRNIVERPPQSDDENGDVGADLRMIGITFAAVSDGLLGRVVDSTGRTLRVYADTPRVYVVDASVSEGRPRLGLDLRRDRPRVVVSGFEREQLFIAEVLRGVISGTLERQVIGFFASGDAGKPDVPDTDVMSTSLVFERARAANIKSMLLAGKGASPAPELPDDARARIQEALAAGQFIVAPIRPVDVAGAKRIAWWQINPRSGATIAVTDEGLYSGTAEGVVVRAKDGTIIVRIQDGSRLYRYTTRSPDLAASYVRTATSNLGVNIQWRGVVELWLEILI